MLAIIRLVRSHLQTTEQATSVGYF